MRLRGYIDGVIGAEDMPPGKRERMARRAEQPKEGPPESKEGKDGPPAKERGRFTLDRPSPNLSLQRVYPC